MIHMRNDQAKILNQKLQYTNMRISTRQLSTLLLLGSTTIRLSPLNRLILFTKTTSVEKSYRHEYDTLLSRSFLSSNRHYARFFSQRNETENPNLPEVEIISKQFIKSSTPTPPNSKTYEVCLFDQVMPNVYMSFVYFYPNNHQNADDDLILKRRQLLKQSLSKTLTRFYPFAGRIKDSRHIDCNDNGVYYVEAKVDNHLFDFLKHPDNKSIHRLLPLDPNSEELLSKNDLAMIQVTVFGCGGVSIGLYTSHKIIDGFSFGTFLKSWSNTAHGSSEQINPTFTSSSVFPSNPALPHDATRVFFPLFSKNKNATRRFLFRPSSLATLKRKAESSRVLAVSGLIWKCAIAASKARSTALDQSSTLTLVINLRDKTSPPAPPHSIGNIFTIANPVRCNGRDELGLDFIVQELKKRTKQFTTPEYMEKFVGFWAFSVEAALDDMKTWYSDKNAKHMLLTSVCRSGAYEVDFGWGKPVWICVGNGDSKSQFTENFVILMDTKCGNGIEAWVTLDEEDMAIFERDPEILAFASLNANPVLEHAVE